jgi:hypothetical protein
MSSSDVQSHQEPEEERKLELLLDKHREMKRRQSQQLLKLLQQCKGLKKNSNHSNIEKSECKERWRNSNINDYCFMKEKDRRRINNGPTNQTKGIGKKCWKSTASALWP